MPRPRADFECRQCQKTIDDLPVKSIRCPLCGRKRGFRRLFNRVQVSTKGHRTARVVDRALAPAYEHHDTVRASAKAFETAMQGALDKQFEVSDAPARERLAAGGKLLGPYPAKAALSQIDPATRADTARYVYPQTKRIVRPLWHR